MKQNKKEKTLFFPYTYKSFPLVSELQNKEKYTISTYLGSGLVGKDIFFAINKDGKDKILVQAIDNINLNEYSNLVVLDFGEDEEIYSIVQEIIQLFNNNVCILSAFTRKKMYGNHHIFQNINRTLDNIDIPVIYVSGIYDSIFNSIASIKIEKLLREKGIKSCVFTPDSNLEYLRFNYLDFPIFNTDNMSYGIEYTIHELFRNILEEVERTSPDVLILQIPGGLVQLNDRIFNSFGIYMTILNSIIPSDYIFCNIPCTLLDEAVINSIQEVVHFKYGKYVNSFMSNDYHVNLDEDFILNVDKDYLFLPNTLLDGLSLSIEKKNCMNLFGSFEQVIVDVFETLKEN